MTVSRTRSRSTDIPVLVTSGGLLVAFVIASLVAPAATGNVVTAAFDLAARGFGALWQVLLLATFAVAVALACSRYGNVRMGDRDRPEYGRFNWISMIMCTLLAGGGVFFAAGEPLQHYVSISIVTLPADHGTWGIGIVAGGGDRAARAARDPAVWTRVIKSYPLVAHWIDAEPVTGIDVMARIVDRVRRFDPLVDLARDRLVLRDPCIPVHRERA